MLLHLFGPFFSRFMCSTGLLSGCLRVAWTQGLSPGLYQPVMICFSCFNSGAKDRASDGDDYESLTLSQLHSVDYSRKKKRKNLSIYLE